MKNCVFQHAAGERHVVFVDDQRSDHGCGALKHSRSMLWKCRSSQPGWTSRPATSSSRQEESGFLNSDLPMATRLRRWPLSHLGFLWEKAVENNPPFLSAQHQKSPYIECRKGIEAMGFSYSMLPNKPGKWILVGLFSMEQFDLTLDHASPAHFWHGVLSKRSGKTSVREKAVCLNYCDGLVGVHSICSQVKYNPLFLKLKYCCWLKKKK